MDILKVSAVFACVFSMSAALPGAYVCNRGTGLCDRTLDSTDMEPPHYNLETCRLVCGAGILWPKPKSFEIEKLEDGSYPIVRTSLVQVDSSVDSIEKEATRHSKDGKTHNTGLVVIDNAIDVFREGLNKISKGQNQQIDKSQSIKISVSFGDHIANIIPGTTNENYTIVNEEVHNQTSTIRIKISSDTYFGARHALETLLQLFAFDGETLVTIKNYKITDSPAYQYRGVMVDTARNFLEVSVLEKIISAMAMNKLNFLHWHMVDSESFPVEIEEYPNMTIYGAYSKDRVYKKADIEKLSSYARSRGVMIVPEFGGIDTAGNGWQWTKGHDLGETALCFGTPDWNKYADQAPFGVFNVANEKLYDMFEKITSQLVDVIEPTFFHIGGHDIDYSCWKNELESDLYDELWRNHTVRVRDMVKQRMEKEVDIHETPTIVWSSQFTKRGTIDTMLSYKDYIIQVWKDPEFDEVPYMVDREYKIILSDANHLFLDCGFGHRSKEEGIDNCDSHQHWSTLYDYKPRDILPSNLKSKAESIIGAEAILWTHQVNSDTAQSHIWPRVAAFAERLWSDPADMSASDVQDRYMYHAHRMKTRADLLSDSSESMFCLENQSRCVSHPVTDSAPLMCSSSTLFVLSMVMLFLLTC